MKNTEQKIPALRFPEFSGEWEEKRLGEIASKPEYGLNTPAVEYDGVNGYIRITDIDENSNCFISKNITSPKEFSEAYLLKKGDLLFARTGASVGKSYLYSEEDGRLFFAGFLIRFPITNANSHFVFYQTLRERFRKWTTIMSARSGQPGINAEEYTSFQFLLPTSQEQQKIADFLSTVDKRLQLLKDKKTKLEEYKRGVMQRIFSQELRFTRPDGSTYPDWEEKRLGEVFTITRGQVLAMGNLKSVPEEDYIYPVYSSQTKDNGLAGYYYKYLFENAITWTTDGANAGDVKYRKGKFYCTNVCGVMYDEIGFANQCVAEIFNSISKKYVSYVGNPKLMNNVVENIVLQLPISLDEQRQIADFLSAIDDKIALLNQQIASTEQYKKGLLQQMFV